MVKLLVRLVINAVSIYVVSALLEGMSVNGFRGALIAAVAFGLMNVFVAPLLKLLALPLTILTLGLFSLVVNGVTLLITAHFIQSLQVNGLGTAILAAMLIAVSNWILSIFFDRE